MNGGLTIGWMIVVFIGGVALGGVFFGGLWLTVRRLPTSSGGHLLFALGFIARMAIVLLGLFWLTRGDWREVLVCLIGFLVARTLIIRQLFGSDSHTLQSQDQPVS